MEDSKNFWEHRFTELFNKDNKENCTAHFDYKEEVLDTLLGEAFIKRTELTITTFNPNKGISFLLLKAIGKTEEEAIQIAFQELISMRKQDQYSSYTLDWGKTGESHTHSSYFYAKNEFEVLRRFYSEVEPDQVIFYGLKVNPIS